MELFCSFFMILVFIFEKNCQRMIAKGFAVGQDDFTLTTTPEI